MCWCLPLLIAMLPCGDARWNQVETVHVQVLEINTFYHEGNQGFPGQEDTYYAIAWEMFDGGTWHVVDACELKHLPVVGGSHAVWLRRRYERQLLRVRYWVIIHSRTPTINVWADREWVPEGNRYHVHKF
jgi:hypothetical protein